MAIESTGSGGGNTVREVKVTAPVDADGRLLVSGITEHDEDSGPVTIDAEQWSALLAALAAGGTGGGSGGGDGTPGDDGRGISSITASGTTATVRYTDGTTSTFQLPQATPLTPRSVSSIVAAANGLTATITYSDATTAQLTLPQGAAGRSITGITASGTTATVSYSTGPTSTFTLPAIKGDAGRSVTSIVAAADGLTATITYSDATTASLTLPQGAAGRSVTGITANGTTATVSYSTGPTTTFTLPQATPLKGDPGKGITSIVAAANGLSATITYTDNTTANLALPRGLAGRGITSVTSSNGVATVTYTDGGTDTFNLPKGDKGNDSTVAGPAGRGITSITSLGNVATVTYTDGSTAQLQLPTPAPARGIASITADGTTLTVTYSDGTSETFDLPAGSGPGAVLPGITVVGDWKPDQAYTAGQSVFARLDGALVQAGQDIPAGVYPFGADKTAVFPWVQLTARGLPGLPGLKGVQDKGIFGAGPYAMDDLVRASGDTSTIYRSLVDNNTAPLTNSSSWSVFLKAQQGNAGAYVTAAAVNDGVLTLTLSNGASIVATGTVGGGTGGGGGGGVSSIFQLTELTGQFLPEGAFLRGRPKVELHTDIRKFMVQWPSGTFNLQVTESRKIVPQGGTDADATFDTNTYTAQLTVPANATLDQMSFALYQALGTQGQYQNTQVTTGGIAFIRLLAGQRYDNGNVITLTAFNIVSDFFSQTIFQDTVTGIITPASVFWGFPDPVNSLPGLIEKDDAKHTTVVGGYPLQARVPGGLTTSGYDGYPLQVQTSILSIGGVIDTTNVGTSVRLRPGTSNGVLGLPTVNGTWLISGTIVATRGGFDDVTSAVVGAWKVEAISENRFGVRHRVPLSKLTELMPIDPAVTLYSPADDGLDKGLEFLGTSSINRTVFAGSLTITEVIWNG